MKKNEEIQDSPINPEFKDEIIKENICNFFSFHHDVRGLSNIT